MAATRRAPPGGRVEDAIAALLFAIALANFLLLAARVGWSDAAPHAILLFVLLAGAYLALSVRRIRLRLAHVFAGGIVGPFIPPAVLLGAIALYGSATGAPLGLWLRDYGLYLFVPVVVALPRAGNPVAVLLAAAALWLPLQFRVLPPILLPPVAGGFDASHLVGLVNGLCLFLVTRPIGRVGFTFLITRGDGVRAVRAFASYAVIALPIGFATGFLAWNPRVTASSLAGVPWLVYLGTAIPEEFLFRGLIQNTCTGLLGCVPGVFVAALIFGLAHLPDWRYALLAGFAGLAYGWVYLKTGKITASAITHTLVDWVWVVLLRA